MNKWEPLFWDGTNYLIVPNTNPDQSSCKQCAFSETRNKTNQCPRYEGPTRKHLHCIIHEERIDHESLIIHDDPEAIANYIAAQLSS